MPFTFVLSIIFAILLIPAVITWRVARPATVAGVGRVARIICAALAGLTVLCLAASCPMTVATQNVGVVTSFGRPVGSLANGFHLKEPWEAVTELDGRIQTDSYLGRNCIVIRIAHQQTACVNASIRWRILGPASPQLFRTYGALARIRTSLVTRQLDVALNQQFANYDPIASLTSGQPEGSPANPTAAQLAGNVATQMRGEIGGQIRVDNVLIPSLTYDGTVQARINSVLAQAAQTDIANLAVVTARAQALANRILSASVLNDPNVLVSRCLDLVNEAIKANYTLQAGFSCFGSSQVGVIAGATAGAKRR